MISTATSLDNVSPHFNHSHLGGGSNNFDDLLQSFDAISNEEEEKVPEDFEENNHPEDNHFNAPGSMIILEGLPLDDLEKRNGDDDDLLLAMLPRQDSKKKTHKKRSDRHHPKKKKRHNHATEQENKEPNKTTVVRFAHVHIRYYNQTVCDNPSVTIGGPAIGLDWTYQKQHSTTTTLSEYERQRAGQRKRHALQLIMARPERERLVKSLGIPQRDVAEMIRSVNKTKTQRRQTVHNMGANQKMEEAVEKVTKRWKKLMGRD